jgi:TrmH family RNA methyltransferase
MTGMRAGAGIEITSPANPRVKAAVALRERRERTRRGLTLVDGAREVRRALDAGIDVVEAFVCDPLLTGADAAAALAALRTQTAPVHRVSRTVFSTLAFGDRAEGLVLVVRVPSLALDDLALPANPLVVVLEGVEKPGNVGAVLRSADGAGADAVIAASPRTDLINPNVIRASAGTVFNVPLAAGSTDEVLAWLRTHAIPILATRVEGARSYTTVDLRGPVAIAMGAEDAGLSDAWHGDGIEAITLPMLGIADSLNVAATAAIVLYEARRQRDQASRGSMTSSS